MFKSVKLLKGDGLESVRPFSWVFGLIGPRIRPDLEPLAQTGMWLGQRAGQGLGQAGGLPFGSPYRFLIYSLNRRGSRGSRECTEGLPVRGRRLGEGPVASKS